MISKKILQAALKNAKRLEKGLYADHTCFVATETERALFTGSVLSRSLSPIYHWQWLTDVAIPEGEGEYLEIDVSALTQWLTHAGADHKTKGVDPSVEFTVRPEELTVTAGVDKLRMPCRETQVEEWKVKDSLAQVLVPSAAVNELLHHTLPYAVADSNREAIAENIAARVSAAGVEMVSTDGYRLAVTRWGEVEDEDEAAALVSRHAWEAVAADGQDVSVCVHDGYIELKTELSTVLCATGDYDAFPDFGRIMSKTEQPVAKLCLDGAEWAYGLRPLLSVRDDRLELQGSGETLVAHCKVDQRKASRIFPVFGLADEVSLTLNGKYFHKAMALCGKKGVKLSYVTSTTPLKLYPEKDKADVKALHVVMPMAKSVKPTAKSPPA